MEKKRHALKKLLEAVEHELLKKPNRKDTRQVVAIGWFSRLGVVSGSLAWRGRW